MTGSTSHRRGLMAWMIACFVALFVATPLLDSFICRAEALNGVASMSLPTPDLVAAEDQTAADVADPAALGHSDDGGPSTCVHGHCHHAGIAAPVAVIGVAQLAEAEGASLRAASPTLLSADLAHAKPPPRA